MNIELDEVVVMNVSDDALEMAAGSAQGGAVSITFWRGATNCFECKEMAAGGAAAF